MPTKKSFRLSKGFTLVELLVVIAIIGILATLLLLQLNVARQRARDVKRIADINQIRTAVELYFDDNGGYPTETMAAMATDVKITPRYLTQVPVDPLGTNQYEYAYNTDLTGRTIQFRVSAQLEQPAQALKSDADIDTTGWTLPATNIGAAADDHGGADCPTTAADCIYDQGQK